MSSPSRQSIQNLGKDYNAQQSDLMQKYFKYNLEQIQTKQTPFNEGQMKQISLSKLYNQNQKYHQQQQHQQSYQNQELVENVQPSYLTSQGSKKSNDMLEVNFISQIQISLSIVQISAGDNHVIILDDQFRVFSQGSNNYGQLGIVGQSFLEKFSCVEVLLNHQIQQISCGSDFSFALSTKGEVFSWGQNCKGQLGLGMNQNVQIPTLVESLVNKETQLKNAGKTQIRTQSCEKISSQQSHLFKRTESLDKLLKRFDKFVAENNFIISQSYEIQSVLEAGEIVSKISCGSLHTLALTTHGKIYSSGYGESFALGHGDEQSTNLFNEIKFFSSTKKNEKNKSNIQSTSIMCEGEYVEDISCGLVHSVCQTNKRMFFWGITSEQPLNIFQLPQEIFLEDLVQPQDNYQQKVIEIQCGQAITLLLTRGGNVYTLGKFQGEISQKDRNIVHIAKRLKSLSSISKICVNGNHCLAYSKDQKKVYGWGSNQYGQLDQGSSLQMVVTPIEVANLNAENQTVLLSCGGNVSYVVTDQPYQIKKKINKTNNAQVQQVPSSPKRSNEREIEIFKTQFENTKKQLILTNNELQKQIEQITHDNYLMVQKEEESQNEAKKIKGLLQQYEKELNFYNKQIQQTTNQNIKFKIQNSEKFKDVKSRTFQSNLEIKFSDLEIQNKITEGGYGIIYKAKWREIVVAVKKFKIDYNNQQQIVEFVNECNAMEALRHPNIVLFLGACTEIPNFSIVMEYCQRGSLWSLLQNQSVPLTWEDRRKIALDIAKGVFFLHSSKPPIIHRDLKSLNVLVDDNFRCKLTDFGWTRVKPQDNYMTNKIGTYQWMAPEVIKAFYYTEKADVFSYSIILWEIASREPPYRGIKGDVVAEKVMCENLRPIIPPSTPKFFQSLIQKCWDANPDNRPTFKQIVKDLEVMIME
ncbi:tyrosine kinase domain protein (macronuclear) [Tetrahymena thermophila SB210]|uniref:non-specific serine/threonine protein kinase n=1 Tax=Tetrahymena thermophila (strain SB210) TaxID=312017 RepID=I7MI13_TETTS|nr:tyrosine kinase domain protein [Tetrahymena thermophila SB210]EAR90768.2 tyrosine kinase domain protein [Tetrahymena thermophila SB210]|eukprot:XP_001011013.2 tyrosine kinase domain protein [Tetrahymena thermophila SB210]